MFNFKLKVRNEHKLHTKVNNEHKISIKSLEATMYEKLTLYTKYCYTTGIEKMLALVKLFLKSTSYRANSSSLANRILSKMFPSSLKYSSSTLNREKFLIKNLLNNISFKSTHSLKERFFSRATPKNTAYRMNSGKAVESLYVRFKDSLTSYKSLSNISTNIISKMEMVSNVSSRIYLSLLFHVKECITNTFKSVDSLKESIFARLNAINKSVSATEVEKDGVNTRLLTNAISDFYNSVSEKVNIVIAKFSFVSKTKSDVNVDEEKVYQHYAHKLSEYKDIKLNQFPKDLLRVCYVIDKDWAFVARIYKTWNGLKDRVASWSDLK